MQRDRDGSPLKKLPPAWGGVVHGKAQVVEGVSYEPDQQFQGELPNAPYELKGPQGEPLPLDARLARALSSERL